MSALGHWRARRGAGGETWLGEGDRGRVGNGDGVGAGGVLKGTLNSSHSAAWGRMKAMGREPEQDSQADPGEPQSAFVQGGQRGGAAPPPTALVLVDWGQLRHRRAEGSLL